MQNSIQAQHTAGSETSSCQGFIQLSGKPYEYFHVKFQNIGILLYAARVLHALHSQDWLLGVRF